jgi:hypothetical protein
MRLPGTWRAQLLLVFLSVTLASCVGPGLEPPQEFADTNLPTRATEPARPAPMGADDAMSTPGAMAGVPGVAPADPAGEAADPDRIDDDAGVPDDDAGVPDEGLDAGF